MKTGLVLEGGAMRGIYTAGVLDTLMESGVSFDEIAGSSAGALFGVNFLSNQKGRVIRYNKRFNGDKNYMGIRPLIREKNLISPSLAYGKVPRELDVFDDGAFRRSAVPFFAAVTDVESGKAEYMQIKSVFEDMEILRASGSMPFVSTPVALGEKKYLDGGIAAPVPFRFLAERGCERLVIVLTRDGAYRKKPMPKAAIKAFYGKYPALCGTLILRHERYNADIEEIKRLEASGKAFVIRPSRPIKTGKLEKNPGVMQKVYEHGIADCREALPRLAEYLGS